MKATTKTLLRLAVTIVLVSASFCLLFANTRLDVSRAQTAERVVKRVNFAGAPVDLTGLEVAGQAMLEKEKLIIARKQADYKELRFDARDEWLRNLNVKFKNVSGKPIIAMRTNLLISHPSLQPSWMVSLVPSRRVPLFRSDSDSSTWETLRPNDEISYSVNNSTLDRIEAELKSKGAIGGILTVELRVNFVSFDDGTAWGYGRNFRRDPDKPDAWVPHKKIASTANKQDLFLKVSHATPSPSGSLYGCYDSNNPLTWECYGVVNCHFQEIGVNYNTFGHYDEIFTRIPCTDQSGITACGMDDYGNNLIDNPNCSV